MPAPPLESIPAIVNKDIKSVTIVPIMDDGHSELKSFSLANLPIRLPKNDDGAFVLESLEMNDEKMVAVMHQDGPISIMNPELIPIDQEGEMLRFDASVDYDYDRETGKITLTYYWEESLTEEELNNIAGFSYFANYDFQLNEEEAITIKLVE